MEGWSFTDKLYPHLFSSLAATENKAKLFLQLCKNGSPARHCQSDDSLAQAVRVVYDQTANFNRMKTLAMAGAVWLRGVIGVRADLTVVQQVECMGQEMENPSKFKAAAPSPALSRR